MSKPDCATSTGRCRKKSTRSSPTSSADLLYTTERSAHQNLAREGIAAERAHFVGNLMIDSLRAAQKGVPPR
jgi:UDP-N-acetylglucosamine 2-epimerase